MTHRDVKPENLLVAFDGGGQSRPRVVLADFGSAIEFGKKKDGTFERYTSEQGSPFWSSPETWKLNYDYRSDCYSCGVVLLVMVAGMLTGDDVRVLHREGLEAMLALRAKYSKTKDAPPGLSVELKRLLEALLAGEDERCSARDALGFPWLADASDRELLNPAAAVLKLRSTERATRVALITLLDDDARNALRAVLSPRPGLPPNTITLSDLLDALRAVPLDVCARVVATLEALGHSDPGLVLVHRPFALENLYVQKPSMDQESIIRPPTTKTLVGVRAPGPMRADVVQDSDNPQPKLSGSKSSDNLASLSGLNWTPPTSSALPDDDTLERVRQRRDVASSVGRKDAPGAECPFARGGITMDGTYTGIRMFDVDLDAM